MTRWAALRPRYVAVRLTEMTMLRLFVWMVAGGILLGSASAASAQEPDVPAYPVTARGGVTGIPGDGYGYYGISASAALAGWPGGAGKTVPVVGGCDECYTLYPLSTISPYTYGPGFGNYGMVPYPYVPVGYGWYGQWWRGLG